MILSTIVQTVIAVLAVIVLVRLNGLRSFSKMSSFDFALTVACGSVLATMMTTTNPPWPSLAALITLFAVRGAIAWMRARTGWAEDLTDNTPLMLMYEGRVLHDNLTASGVTEGDLRAKLREANALQLDQVRAVVLETTGDVSVMHGDALDPALLRGVGWGNCEPAENAEV